MKKSERGRQNRLNVSPLNRLTLPCALALPASRLPKSRIHRYDITGTRCSTTRSRGDGAAGLQVAVGRRLVFCGEGGLKVAVGRCA